MNNRDLLEKTLNICTFICFAGLITVVSLQIVSRFLPISFVWTEEASRFLFIFSVAFAAPLAMKRKEYVNVDLIISFLPNKARQIYEMLIYLVITLFMCVVMFQGVHFIRIGENQTSATMTVPMSIPHASMTIAGLFMGVYALLHVIKNVREVYRGGEHS